MKLKNSLAMLFLGVCALLILVGAFLAVENDYEKMMNPLMKIKENERKSGIKTPAFDGEVEPPFPSLKINDETLEGVDSNHNGIRDDLEIWINRTFKDDVIRKGMKKIAFNANEEIPFIQRGNREVVKDIEFKTAKVYACLSYLNKKESNYLDQNRLIDQVFWKLYFNNSSRRKLHGKLGILIAGDGYSLEVSKNYCDF